MPGLGHIPVISAFRRPRQRDFKFQASLGYTVRSCLQRKRKEKGKVKNRNQSFLKFMSRAGKEIVPSARCVSHLQRLSPAEVGYQSGDCPWSQATTIL